jgi:hypothetical protein
MGRNQVSQKSAKPFSCRFNTLFHWANERNHNSCNYWKAILSFCCINQLTLAACFPCRDCFSVEQTYTLGRGIVLLPFDSCTFQSFWNQFWLHPWGNFVPYFNQLRRLKITLTCCWLLKI